MPSKNAHKSNTAIRYRIMPNCSQRTLCIKTFGCCRFVYNQILELQEQLYQSGAKHMSRIDANNHCNRVLKEEYPWLREVDKFALTNSIYHLEDGYQRMFSHLGKKPRYKSAKRSRRSYTTNCTNGNIVVGDNYIKLPKVGKVKAVIHRKTDLSWTVKSATISMESDGSWYCSVLYEYDKNIVPVVPDKDNAIGLDYKSDGLYYDSEGNIATEHKYYRESQDKLAKEQRRLSRKVGSKKGETPSNNFKKQQLRVNKVHRHTANQRKDFLHKKSTEIANQYDIVCVESLNMCSMSNKGFGNGKATMDNGYGMFLNMLEYKLRDRGKYFVKVPKWFPSSQTCHKCGMIHPEMKNLSNGHIRCECGYTNQRDYNAALNIRDKGLEMLGIA